MSTQSIQIYNQAAIVGSTAYPFDMASLERAIFNTIFTDKPFTHNIATQNDSRAPIEYQQQNSLFERKKITIKMMIE